MPEIYFSHDKMRKGQDAMVADVLKALHTNSHAVCHAPLGIGKTAAALCPSITHALENDLTVFFLTPKITQHAIAMNEIKAIEDKYELGLKAIDIVGKKHACTDPVLKHAEPHVFYEVCRRRLKKEGCDHNKVIEVEPGIWKHKDLFEECIPRKACAYETSIRLAREANIVVCDYFHVLLPRVATPFLSHIRKNIEKSIIIIDEAQNVGSRIRSQLSTTVSDFIVTKAIEESNEFPKLEVLLKTLKALRKLGKGEQYITKDKLPHFSSTEVLDIRNQGLNTMEKTKKTRSYLVHVSRFLEHWKEPGDEFTRILSVKGNRVGVSCKCLDPSVATKNTMQATPTVIAMSGTLSPMRMYSDLLGMPPQRTGLYQYTSPFPIENRGNIISTTVTTKYEARNNDMFQLIAKQCEEIVNQVPGNAALFFSSYNLMRQVLSMFSTTKPLFVQKENSPAKENTELLNNFISKSAFGAVLSGVCGGSFAEGIDLPGSQLMAAVIVGVPLAEPDLETKALIEYYNSKFGKGWEYGYSFPAMNRAIQAAGRVIRSEKDIGVAVFLDQRFSWKKYASCFAQDIQFVQTSDPGEAVRQFFSEQ